MNRLSTNELRQLIKKSGMTTEEYYKKLFALQEDIEFFNLYMKRNKKSYLSLSNNEYHMNSTHCHLLLI